MTRLLLLVSFALAIAGCGRDEIDPKDGVAARLEGVKPDPKLDRPTAAARRFERFRGQQHGGGMGAK